MKIKIVGIQVISYCAIPGAKKPNYAWQTNKYIKLIDDNNNVHYIVNEKLVSKEEGNKHYLNIKESNTHYQGTEECKNYCRNNHINPSDTFVRVEFEKDISLNELINNVSSKIDRYTQYIDDAGQLIKAERRNAQLRNWIEWLNNLR